MFKFLKRKKIDGRNYRPTKLQIRFKYKDEEPYMRAYHDIQIVYCEDGLYGKRGCVDGLTEKNGGGSSLYLGESYVCFDFDIESRRIDNFGGWFILKTVPCGKIALPAESKDVILCVKTDGGYMQGCGTRIEFSDKILYDKANRILQFGECDYAKPYLRFLKNAYAQFDENGYMRGFLITDITE